MPRPTVTKIRDLTGPGHTDRFGVGGTDLGAAALAPDGRIVVVFGDTFDGAGVGGRGWRSPIVLFADPATLAHGLEWTGSGGSDRDYADQILPYRHDKKIAGRRISTVLPTDVITVGDTMFLHVMACQGLGNVHWTELHASRDSGRTWEPTGAWWPGDHLGGLFQMLTWERGGDGWVYAFSTGFQRDKGLLLARVPEDRLTDPGAWEGWGFRDGAWGWGNPPTLVLPGAFGEMSLRRVGDTWWLAVFDAGLYRIDLVRLDNGPVTNLHEAPRSTVVAGCGWHDEDHGCGRAAQPYGGYIVPGSAPDDVHLIVSQWNTGTNWPYRSMHFRAVFA